MKILFAVLMSNSLIGFASEAKEFDFGHADVQNNCANIKLQVAARIDMFTKFARLPSGTFSYEVSEVQRHKTGQKGSYDTCLANILSASASYVIDERENSVHYGADRNSNCLTDREAALNDPKVIGTRMNINQGWIFNLFCQSFELIIRSAQ